MSLRLLLFPFDPSSILCNKTHDIAMGSVSPSRTGSSETTPMGPKNEETETQAKERTQKWMKMTVNESGDLYVPDMGTISAAELYLDYLKGEVRVGPGIPGPWVQFRE